MSATKWSAKRTIATLALFLFFGAVAHLALYGEPAWSTLGSWLAIVFWPLVLIGKVIVLSFKVWLTIILGFAAAAVLLLAGR